MKEKLDYIVIGQGIAGTTIAWWLNFNKKQFYILNDEKKNTSSSAALGIYNPITGRNSVKTWNAEILFKELEKFYSKVEKKIKKKILYKKNIYRPYKNIKEYSESLKYFKLSSPLLLFWGCSIPSPKNDSGDKFIIPMRHLGLSLRKSSQLKESLVC